MRKPTVSMVWLWGLAGIAGGIVAIVLGTVLMLANGGTYGGPSGQDFTPTLNAFFWWMVALIAAGAMGLVAGGIAQLVAWIGALVNTYELVDRTWFIVLLIAGVAGFVGMPIAGFVAMVAYLLMGPDSKAPAGAGIGAGAPPARLATAP